MKDIILYDVLRALLLIRFHSFDAVLYIRILRLSRSNPICTKLYRYRQLHPPFEIFAVRLQQVWRLLLLVLS